MENIKSKNFTHKILPLLGVFLFSLFFLTVTSFGADRITIDDITYSCTSGYMSSDFFDPFSYACLMTNEEGTEGILFLADQKFTLSYSDIVFEVPPSNFAWLGKSPVTFNESTKTYTWQSDGRSTILSNKTDNTITTFPLDGRPFPINGFSFSGSILPNNYVKASGNTVFQMPLQGTLAPLAKEANMAQVMKEIVEILPIILITIVGLISLRKGLQLLSTVLHQS